MMEHDERPKNPNNVDAKTPQEELVERKRQRMSDAEFEAQVDEAIDDVQDELDALYGGGDA